MSGERRSTREIRRSLAAARERLDEDLEELELRMEDSLNPRKLATRHPLLVAVAGLLLGVLVVRRPALVGRSLSRLLGITAPFLVRAVLNRGSSGAGAGAATSTSGESG
jgi:hypothetical protein